MSASNIIGV